MNKQQKSLLHIIIFLILPWSPGTSIQLVARRIRYCCFGFVYRLQIFSFRFRLFLLFINASFSFILHRLPSTFYQSFNGCLILRILLLWCKAANKQYSNNVRKIRFKLDRLHNDDNNDDDASTSCTHSVCTFFAVITCIHFHLNIVSLFSPAQEFFFSSINIIISNVAVCRDRDTSSFFLLRRYILYVSYLCVRGWKLWKENIEKTHFSRVLCTPHFTLCSLAD